MNASQIYIAISIATLIIVALLVYVVSKRKKEKGLSPLAGLAFGFILAGILFGDERFAAYGLMGVGMVLAVIDMIQQKRSKNPESSAGSTQ